jgi:hypothetical protein
MYSVSRKPWSRADFATLWPLVPETRAMHVVLVSRLPVLFRSLARIRYYHVLRGHGLSTRQHRYEAEGYLSVDEWLHSTPNHASFWHY